MEKETLRKYAELIARVGVNVQPVQAVLIEAGLDQPGFVALLAEECYKAGAAKVSVNWSSPALTRLDVRYQSEATLCALEPWEFDRAQYRVETLPAKIWLISDDPDALAGIDQEKYAKGLQARKKALKPYSDATMNRQQWCIAAVPGEAWARKVFPGLLATDAVEALWAQILSASRVTEDPTAAWREHNAALTSRCERLNAMRLRSLEYKSANGTDFRVGLMPQGRFAGSSERTLGTKVEFNPNIPTEEVFTSPKRGEAEGIIFGTKPAALRGVIVEDFSIRFEKGRAVEVHAAKNEDVLRSFLETDEGASYLGECALVPHSSPISRSGLLFHEALFDENAACHIAFGLGFAECVEGFEELGLEGCRALGLNDSVVHEDLMIGSADLSIVGVTEDGERIQIFKDGEWAF